MDEPRFEIKSLTEMATYAHEMYLSYMAAGFTAEQALRLVIATIQSAGGSSNG
jgi:hypothetical protein